MDAALTVSQQQSNGAFARRRGRPPKSLDATTQRQAVALDEYAALRAYLQGLTPQEACRRFLAREEAPSGESPALRRLIGILGSVAHAAEQRLGADQELACAAAMLRERAGEATERRAQLLRVAAHERRRKAVSGQPRPGAATVLPADADPGLPEHLLDVDSFTEWYTAERADPGWSESEWLDALEDAIAEWRAEQADAPSPALVAPLGAIGHVQLLEARAPNREPISDAQRSLQALERCRYLVAREPQASDLVGAWFSPTTAQRLRAADLPTLYTLVELVSRRGSAWWRRVPGLGPTRAGRIDAWLRSVGIEAGLRLQPEPLASRALSLPSAQLEELASHRLEPLALVLQDADLAGRTGAFRVAGANMLGAQNDLEAIIAALGKYSERPGTRKVYAQEILRFCLWCWRELGKPLSSVTITDARAYRAFLRNIPSDWINPDPTPRTSPVWRPFRGQLSPISIRNALTAVHVIMGQLHQTGYLSGNALAGVAKDANLPPSSLDPTRSFTRDQWALVLEVLDRQPSQRRLAALERLASSDAARAEALRRLEYAKARRLQALVHLLRATGIRRDELYTARLSGLTTLSVQGTEEPVLRVMGKRRKQRQVYVPREVLELVRAHLADRPIAGFDDDLDSQAGLDRIPLISVLSPPPPRQAGADGEHADPSGALGPSAIYALLRRFFGEVATVAGGRGLDGSRFRRASTHWLRHTFGRLAADDAVPERSIQRALGHSNPATTRIYTQTDEVEMIADIRRAVSPAARAE